MLCQVCKTLDANVQKSLGTPPKLIIEVCPLCEQRIDREKNPAKKLRVMRDLARKEGQ